MSDELALRYWTWPELQSFAIEHDLVIAEGVEGSDHAVLTGRGEELAMFFGAMLKCGGGMPRGAPTTTGIEGGGERG